MGYVQHTVPDTVAVEPTCCFPLALANISPWPLVTFFQISLKNSKLKTTPRPFGNVACTFLTTFLGLALCNNKKFSFCCIPELYMEADIFHLEKMAMK